MDTGMNSILVSHSLCLLNNVIIEFILKNLIFFFSFLFTVFFLLMSSVHTTQHIRSIYFILRPIKGASNDRVLQVYARIERRFLHRTNAGGLHLADADNTPTFALCHSCMLEERKKMANFQRVQPTYYGVFLYVERDAALGNE